MVKGFLHSHLLFSAIFILIYLVKTILLLSDREELLEKFKQKTKILEMIASFLFLGTGIALLILIPGAINTYMIIKISIVLMSIPLAVVGYKKKNKVLAALSFFMLIVAFVLAGKAKTAKSEIKISTEIVDAKQIFNSTCASCHGSDGKLGAAGAKDLTKTQLNHQEIFTIISDGKGVMVPYKGLLTKQQIEAVSSYIETDLKGK